MVKTGIERIDEYINIFKDKRVGLITNPTGVDNNFRSTIDILRDKVNLVVLFSPEHGIRGNLQAGERLDTYVDETTGLTVYSLYGKTRKPTAEMLELFDILVFDIQDTGARFYTYLYTMAYAMIACKETNKEFVVLDRPNPVNSTIVEGNMLDINFRSFIGYYSIPQRYGLTIGELAKYFNDKEEIKATLHVIPMENYKRSMTYKDTGLKWVLPSPNIPTEETPLYYLCTCIFEGTNLSEGRGTAKPFHMFGSPYLNNYDLAKKLNDLNLAGVMFRPTFFTPTFSKHTNELCKGIELHITNINSFEPVKTGYLIVDIIRNDYQEFDFIPPFSKGGKPFIDLLTGSDDIRNNVSLEKILNQMNNDGLNFTKEKRRYEIYE